MDVNWLELVSKINQNFSAPKDNPIYSLFTFVECFP